MTRKKAKAGGNRFKNKVAQNVQAQKTKRSQYGHLRVPKGTQIYKETPGGRCSLDFLLYEVTDEKHPDRNDDDGIAVPGELWYRRPYFLHRNVGVDNSSAICPTSVGNKCPVCEYRAKLLREGANWQSDEVKALKASLRNLYVVVPLGSKDYEEEPHVWDISQFLFQDKLNEELEEDEENMGFPDLDDGLTLRIRFTEEKFGTNTFAETSRIDFEDRKEQYGEAILEEVPNLDEMIAVPGYKELERRFFELEEADPEQEIDEGEEPEEEPEEERRPSRRRGKRADPEPEEEEERPSRRRELPAASRRGKDPEPEPEEEEPEEEPEDEPEEEPRSPRRKKKAGGKKRGKKAGGKKAGKGKEEERCPYGYRFGVDTDDYDECDKCEIWEECIEAKEASDA